MSLTQTISKHDLGKLTHHRKNASVKNMPTYTPYKFPYIFAKPERSFEVA
jgi:hypothetical protein